MREGGKKVGAATRSSITVEGEKVPNRRVSPGEKRENKKMTQGQGAFALYVCSCENEVVHTGLGYDAHWCAENVFRVWGLGSGVWGLGSRV
eukprot:2187046-Rhodomonas_salina.1